jgi:hypothetical protein
MFKAKTKLHGFKEEKKHANRRIITLQILPRRWRRWWLKTAWKEWTNSWRRPSWILSETRGIFLTFGGKILVSYTFTSLLGEEFSGVNKYKECGVVLHSSAVSYFPLMSFQSLPLFLVSQMYCAENKTNLA